MIKALIIADASDGSVYEKLKVLTKTLHSKMVAGPYETCVDIAPFAFQETNMKRIAARVEELTTEEDQLFVYLIMHFGMSDNDLDRLDTCKQQLHLINGIDQVFCITFGLNWYVDQERIQNTVKEMARVVYPCSFRYT